MSKKLKRRVVLFCMMFVFVMSTAEECTGPNLIDRIISNKGTCTAVRWGGHCD